MQYGLIGEHLPHSFSPEIHRRIGDYPYELKELSPQEVGAFLQRREFKGTIPSSTAAANSAATIPILAG